MIGDITHRRGILCLCRFIYCLILICCISQHVIWRKIVYTLHMYHLLFVIQERGKFNSMVDKHSRELSDLKASLTEESDARTRLQLELDARESEIEQLKQKLVASDTVSISSGNDLDTDLDAVGMCIFVGKSHLPFRIFCLLTTL